MDIVEGVSQDDEDVGEDQSDRTKQPEETFFAVYDILSDHICLYVHYICGYACSTFW